MASMIKKSTIFDNTTITNSTTLLDLSILDVETSVYFCSYSTKLAFFYKKSQTIVDYNKGAINNSINSKSGLEEDSDKGDEDNEGDKNNEGRESLANKGEKVEKDKFNNNKDQTKGLLIPFSNATNPFLNNLDPTTIALPFLMPKADTDILSQPKGLLPFSLK